MTTPVRVCQTFRDVSHPQHGKYADPALHTYATGSASPSPTPFIQHVNVLYACLYSRPSNGFPPTTIDAGRAPFATTEICFARPAPQTASMPNI